MQFRKHPTYTLYPDTLLPCEWQDCEPAGDYSAATSRGFGIHLAIKISSVGGIATIALRAFYNIPTIESARR